MADNTEIEDRVDLDDDNYSEEDDEETMQDEGAGEGGEDVQDDMQSDDGGKEQSPGTGRNDINIENVKDGENSASIKDEDSQKHAELLDLPPHGSEIFIGGLSRDVSEEDLRELCEPFGEIFEIRVVKNRDTGESKDFMGRTLRCSLSESKYRLFIGNVPKVWTDDEFRKIIEATGPGAETIELIKDPQNTSRNRGFAFVEEFGD